MNQNNLNTNNSEENSPIGDNNYVKIYNKNKKNKKSNFDNNNKQKNQEVEELIEEGFTIIDEKNYPDYAMDEEFIPEKLRAKQNKNHSHNNIIPLGNTTSSSFHHSTNDESSQNISSDCHKKFNELEEGDQQGNSFFSSIQSSQIKNEKKQEGEGEGEDDDENIQSLNFDEQENEEDDEDSEAQDQNEINSSKLSSNNSQNNNNNQQQQDLKQKHKVSVKQYIQEIQQERYRKDFEEETQNIIQEQMQYKLQQQQQHILQQQQKLNQQQQQQRQQLQQLQQNSKNNNNTNINNNNLQLEQQQLQEQNNQQFQQNQTISRTNNDYLASQDKNSEKFQQSEEIMAAVAGIVNKQRSQSQKIYQEVLEGQEQKEKKETINQAYLLRKKQSFQLLQLWSEKQQEFIQAHQQICNSIIFQCDQKINLSTENMKMIYRFFQIRKENEIAYSVQLQKNMPRLSQLSNQNHNQQQQTQSNIKESKSKIKENNNNNNWYPLLTQALAQTDRITDSQAQKIQDFAKFLEKDILKDQLGIEINEFQACSKKIKLNLQKHSQNLKKNQTLAQQRYQKYARVYQQSVDKSQKKNKDLYNWELKFRRECYHELDSLKLYGQSVIQYLEETQKLEMTRLQHIQRCFKFYISKHLETYGNNQELEEIMKLFSQFDPIKEGKLNFSADNLLTKTQIDLIVSGKKQQQSFQNCLHNFLFKFNYPDIDSMEQGQHRLVLKKYKAYKDIGTIGFTWKQVELIFTIDDFLLFFDGDDHQNLKASQRKMGCEKIRIQKREKNNKDLNMCYIVEKKQGVIFNSTQKMLVKFENADAMCEFKFFLQRYCPSKDLEINI